MGHESDVETDAKLLLVKNMKLVIDQYSQELRIFQSSIRALDMIPQTDENRVTTYVLPKNPAGNEMDSDYRDTMKSALCTNIDALLVKLSGFLAIDNVE